MATTIGEKYKQAIDLFSKGWMHYTLLAIGYAVIMQMLNAPFAEDFRTLQEAPEPDSMEEMQMYYPAYGRVIFYNGFLATIVYILYTCFFIYLTVGLYKNVPIDWRELTAYSFKKWLPLIGALIIPYILTFIGFMLLVIPGVILYYMFIFVPFIVLLEDGRVFSAFKESSRQTKGRRMRLFLATAPFYLAATLVLNIIFSPDSAGVSSPIAGIVTAISMLIFVVPHIVVFLFYAEARQDSAGLPTPSAL